MYLTEDYVSFEIAKLLKEKGFDVPTMYFFSADGTKRKFQQAHYPEDIAQPTHQMALKWLREVHDYYIQIMLDSWACGGHLGYYVVIQDLKSDFEIMLQDVVDEVFYQTYEEAVEAALKYTLENLI